MVTNTTGSGAAATPIVAGKRVHICGLHIENYRSIINYDFSFSPDCNILVGQNNVGKSNLLKALDIVIGERSQTLYPKDYNDPDSDIIIRVTLCWHSVPTTIHQEGQCCQGSEQVVLEFKCAAIRRDDVLIKDKQKGEVTLAQNSSGETLPTIKRKLRFIYIPSLRD